MSNLNVLIIKTLLLLWVVCVVWCEHQKRDVHHRIVIKERIPRSHKKGHHARGHAHKNGNHHSSRSKSHGHKKGKKQVSSYEKESYEDDSSSQSRSRENSFEDIFQKPQKSRKPHHHHHDVTSHSSSQFFSNQDFQETKQVPYKEYSKFMGQNEWTPLSSEQVHQVSHETYRDRHKRKRDNKKNHMTSLKPPPIDLTTSYPFQFESTSIFPEVMDYSNAFSNFNLNQKIIESNQAPLIGTIEQPKLEFAEIKNNYNTLNNQQANFQVTELSPSGSNSNTFISVPDDIISEHSNEQVTTQANNQMIIDQKREQKTTQKPRKTRGRFTYRGQKQLKK